VGLFVIFTNAAVQDRPLPSVSEAISVELFVQLRSRPQNDPAPATDRGDLSRFQKGQDADIGTSQGETDLEAASLPAPETSGSETVAADPAWISATSFHAQDVLSDPRSAQARLALGTLVAGDRREQLCALEAMEQLRRTQPDFRPTRLAPHAFRNSFQRQNKIVVPAGAVRSNRIWYEIAYNCQLNGDGSDIESFEFALGNEIDRSLWDEHGLAPIH
ncbi:MAG: DUF930 domain-containing protein, partial [Roseibium sp.]|uniref:DUF930 domain-containing protein n=1 Tax=Roseibium sp. TaxID=1936156 RepID=UPI00262B3FA7